MCLPQHRIRKPNSKASMLGGKCMLLAKRVKVKPKQMPVLQKRKKRFPRTRHLREGYRFQRIRLSIILTIDDFLLTKVQPTVYHLGRQAPLWKLRRDTSVLAPDRDGYPNNGIMTTNGKMVKHTLTLLKWSQNECSSNWKVCPLLVIDLQASPFRRVQLPTPF